MSAKQDALNNGGGTVANPVYLYNGVTKNIKALRGGTNVSLSPDSQDVVTVSAPDVYNKTEVDGKLTDKVPWVSDTLLQLDAIYIDIVRPKKSRTNTCQVRF